MTQINSLRNLNSVSSVASNDYIYIAKNNSSQGDGKAQVSDVLNASNIVNGTLNYQRLGNNYTYSSGIIGNWNSWYEIIYNANGTICGINQGGFISITNMTSDGQQVTVTLPYAIPNQALTVNAIVQSIEAGGYPDVWVQLKTINSTQVTFTLQSSTNSSATWSPMTGIVWNALGN